MLRSAWPWRRVSLPFWVLGLFGAVPEAMASPGESPSLGQLLGPFLFVALLATLAGLYGRFSNAEEEQKRKEREERRRREPRRMSVEEGIARIASQDPGFDPGAFLNRASHAYRIIHRAWNRQDLALIRPFVSDAIHERSALQLAERRRRGIRDVFDDFIVQDKTIEQIDLSEHFQTITVRFRVEARSFQVDTGERLVSGDTFPRSTATYWAFVRRTGATTLGTGGLIEGNCPNCGTLIRLNQTGICRSCNAKVWSGRYDWVLTEITDESVWHVQPHDWVPGVQTLSQSDPAFCLQQLHDHASAIFWRRITAWQAGDITMLQNVATAEYCRAMAEELAPDPDGTRRIPADVVVDAVEAEGILCEAPLDQALVRVNWSTGAERLFPDGTRQQTIGVGFRVSFLLLVRRHGAQGSLDDALSSSHCRGCGAPATASFSAVCENCGRPLVDGERDWLLTAVYLAGEAPVAAFRSRFQEMPPGNRSRGDRLPSSGRELMAWLAQTMVADGRIDEAGKELLGAVAARHGVTKSELGPLLLAAQAGELDLALPPNAKIARRWLGALAEMALVDGKVSEEESKVIRTLGNRLGLGKKKVAGIISGTRTRRAR